MKIVAVSDVHEKWQKLEIPECDLLLSCGDYSFRGASHVVKAFHEWLSQQKATHIISVQGNHEVWVEKNWDEARLIAQTACPRVHFISHDLVEIEHENETYKIFGSAWTPFFHNWAWNARRGDEIRRYWDQIPLDVDVLITHGPPQYIGDTVYYADGVTPREHVGCEDLMNRILQLPKLKHHFFGHIHGSHGHTYFKDTHFHNVAICDEMYMPSNSVTIIEFDKS